MSMIISHNVNASAERTVLSRCCEAHKHLYRVTPVTPAGVKRPLESTKPEDITLLGVISLLTL